MKNKNLQTLLTVMAKLRDPGNGCVLSKQQAYQSLMSRTLEEAMVWKPAG